VEKTLAIVLPIWQLDDMANSLEQYRKFKGITRSALAAELGISASYVTRLLRGERSPGGALVARIERVTEGAVTVRDLFPGEAGHAAHGD
jgi:transcriptional regulator with XRE-family HTH domain